MNLLEEILTFFFIVEVDDDITKGPLEKMFNEHGLTGSEDYLSSYSSHYPTNNINSTYNSSTILSPFQSKV